MPILDPILQNALLNETSGSDTAEIEFFVEYLKMSSDYIYKNYNSIISSLQFRKDIKKCRLALCDHFKINIPSDMEMNMPDCYHFLYQKLINKKYKNQRDPKVQRNAKDFISFSSTENSINNLYNNFRFFKILSNYSRTWFINDYKTAFLCLRIDSNQESAFDLVPLEIDLLSTLGYTLVLCASGFSNARKDRFDTFYEILKDHSFSEIHINFDHDQNLEGTNFLRIMEKIYTNSDQFDGYFYIYTQYFKKNGKQYKGFKNYKRPRINYFYFSDKIDKSLIKITKETTSIFKYNIGSEEKKRIKILLCNTPLYENKDDALPKSSSSDNKNYNENFPNEPKIATILSDDFLYCENNKVEVQIATQTKYIEFDDLHLINPYFYTIHPIYLAKTDKKELNIVENVIKKAEDECQKSKNFKKKKFFNFLKDQKILESLKYILYAYKLYKPGFELRKSQIYVVLKAVDFCIKNANIKDDKQRGFIYQVATGEGKTSIITMIAAVLALSKKVVHVVTANYLLACRDFFDSYDFFNKLGIKSGALLHENEINYKDKNEKDKFQEIFDQKNFKNPLGMNIDICKKESKVKIIFSTIVNFESLYLHYIENYPNRLSYYQNCSLVIDEADMILIDELTNGTILSKQIKTNGEEVLRYVYKLCSQIKEKDKDKNTDKIDPIYNKICSDVKEKYPKCVDLKNKDILTMHNEIKMIDEKNSNFVNGARYYIDLDKKTNKEEIYPVNCDKTGIIEKNKEFGGFIQQFIGIKEKYFPKNKDEQSKDAPKQINNNLSVKSVSMNYLYISHPIYISLYGSVCGLTGTLGNKYDKNIYKQNYKLESKIIPRNSPNKLYEYPITVCKTIKRRNERILQEVLAFHKLQIPVLVIFKQLNEITSFQKLLKSLKYYIFDGREENNETLKKAGEKGSILLGTNVCGRGADIKISQYHLHVIISFYTSNKRIMDQAYGRTARNNNFGTVRIICLLDEYQQNISLINQVQIEDHLHKFRNINQLQNEFIEYFRSKREWIFGAQIKRIKITTKQADEMRQIPINVNRIISYEYEFPICMSVNTFLDIQSQKILSLYNCPNCSYSWLLFQQYVREMILNSWSIFINKLERRNKVDKIRGKFKKLEKKIEIYLPNDKEKLGIVDTFIHIAQTVSEKYKYVSEMIKSNFLFSDNNDNKFSYIRLGFRPFCLRDKSGIRLGSAEEDKEIGYIEDPELLYLQKKGSSIRASITKCIDLLFDKIFQFFNNFINQNIAMKFFLRRTLGGCEFGICYDFEFENTDDQFKNDTNRLIDIDPMFIFSIHICSYTAFMASVLILLLLYLLNLARKIFSFMSAGQIVKTVAKEAAEYCVGKLLDCAEEKIIERITEYLKEIIETQMEKIGFSNEVYSVIIDWIVDFVSGKLSDKIDTVHDFLKEKFKFNFKFKIKSGKFDFYKKRLFRLGFLLVICAASFLLLFKAKQPIAFNREKVAKKYADSEDKEEEFNTVKRETEPKFKNFFPNLKK